MTGNTLLWSFFVRFAFCICFSHPSGETTDFLERHKERSLHSIRGLGRPKKECCPKPAWWANEFTGVIYRRTCDLKVATSQGHLTSNMSDWQQLRYLRISSPVFPVFISYIVLGRRGATWGPWEDIMSPVSLPSLFPPRPPDSLEVSQRWIWLLCLKTLMLTQVMCETLTLPVISWWQRPRTILGHDNQTSRASPTFPAKPYKIFALLQCRTLLGPLQSHLTTVNEVHNGVLLGSPLTLLCFTAWQLCVPYRQTAQRKLWNISSKIVWEWWGHCVHTSYSPKFL